ncbi:hypothetical protein CsSME_00044514 [Camellia sinensis var. sinensis]
MRSQGHTLSACPSNVRWTDDGLERDLYISTSTVTVLAMDGRMRCVRCSTVFKSFFNRIPCSFHGSSFRAKGPMKKATLYLLQILSHVLGLDYIFGLRKENQHQTCLLVKGF